MTDEHDGLGRRLDSRLWQKEYRDGTTHIVLEPVDFMARLAALGRPFSASPPAA